MMNNALEIWCNYFPSSSLSFKRLSFQPRILPFSLISLLSFPKKKRYHTCKTFIDNLMTITSLCFPTLSSISQLETIKRSQTCPIRLLTIPSLWLCRTLERIDVLWVPQKVSHSKGQTFQEQTLQSQSYSKNKQTKKEKRKKALSFPL